MIRPTGPWALAWILGLLEEAEEEEGAGGWCGVKHDLLVQRLFSLLCMRSLGPPAFRACPSLAVSRDTGSYFPTAPVTVVCSDRAMSLRRSAVSMMNGFKLETLRER